jgi:hypothetical protein
VIAIKIHSLGKYFNQYILAEQKRCRLGGYECATGKQCVNYAQHENRDWMLCQCPAGKKRGKYCSDGKLLNSKFLDKD